MLRLIAWFSILFVVSSAQAQTPDYAREKRWADEVVPSLLVGEAVWLQGIHTTRDAGKHGERFLALYAKQAVPRSAVILVHGTGIHPDYGMIGELRTRLADAGLSTLSLQMPLLAAGAPADDYAALFDEAAGRIAAGVAFLQSAGAMRIVLVAHSMGARMGQRYVTANPGAPLAAWVPLAILNGEFEPLLRPGYPVFDIYGERDFPAVSGKAVARARTIASIPGSRQAMVPGADHYFAGKEKELAELIGGFIASLK